MVYTSLFSFENGTSLPVDYGSGIEYADGVLNSLFAGQDVGLQIGLWLEGKEGCQKIISGQVDNEIYKMINYFEKTSATKIFLRIGYEFDNPGFNYKGDGITYQNAFRYIVNKCREHLSQNSLFRLKFVWHSWAAPRGGNNIKLEGFYPGDEYVHWIGISVFTQVYSWSKHNSYGGSIQDIEEVLNFAKLHDKPTMIAESTPFGGINEIPKINNIPSHKVWDVWFQRVLNLITKYDIAMWSYINCGWDNQPMWHNIGFGESRISSNKIIMKKWKELVLNDDSTKSSSRFLFSGSLSNCGHSSGGNTTTDIMKKSNDNNAELYQTSQMLVPTKKIQVETRNNKEDISKYLSSFVYKFLFVLVCVVSIITALKKKRTLMQGSSGYSVISVDEINHHEQTYLFS